jgi:hypothetical protein
LLSDPDSARNSRVCSRSSPVISTFVNVVALFMVVSFALRSAPVQAQPAVECPRDATPASPEPPSNFHVDEILQPVVSALLAKSPTFRRQWDIINASRLVRVRVLSIIGLQDESLARARGQVSRYAFGSMRATIEIPIAADVTELLPHELEHVIEQLEGLDLAGLAQRGEQGVVEVRRGMYETARARAAGLQVVREVYAELDPAVSAAFSGVKRLFRAFGARPGRGAGAPAPEAAATAHLHKRR